MGKNRRISRFLSESISSIQLVFGVLMAQIWHSSDLDQGPNCLSPPSHGRARLPPPPTGSTSPPLRRRPCEVLGDQLLDGLVEVDDPSVRVGDDDRVALADEAHHLTMPCTQPAVSDPPGQNMTLRSKRPHPSSTDAHPLANLLVDTVFAALPPGSTKTGEQKIPAHKDPVIFGSGGTYGAGYDIDFTSTAPAPDVYADLDRRARAAG